MSLDYNLIRIKDRGLLHNTVGDDGEPPFPKGSPEDLEGDVQWTITESMIFRTMFIGLSSITETNYKEFYRRCLVASRLIGAPMYRRGEHYNFTLHDIKIRIGLSTNASPYTKVQFDNKMRDILTHDSVRELNLAVRELEKVKA